MIIIKESEGNTLMTLETLVVVKMSRRQIVVKWKAMMEILFKKKSDKRRKSKMTWMEKNYLQLDQEGGLGEEQ